MKRRLTARPRRAGGELPAPKVRKARSFPRFADRVRAARASSAAGPAVAKPHARGLERTILEGFSPRCRARRAPRVRPPPRVRPSRQLAFRPPVGRGGDEAPRSPFLGPGSGCASPSSRRSRTRRGQRGIRAPKAPAPDGDPLDSARRWLKGPTPVVRSGLIEGESTSWLEEEPARPAPRRFLRRLYLPAPSAVARGGALPKRLLATRQVHPESAAGTARAVLSGIESRRPAVPRAARGRDHPRSASPHSGNGGGHRSEAPPPTQLGVVVCEPVRFRFLGRSCAATIKPAPSSSRGGRVGGGGALEEPRADPRSPCRPGGQSRGRRSSRLPPTRSRSPRSALLAPPRGIPHRREAKDERLEDRARRFRNPIRSRPLRALAVQERPRRDPRRLLKAGARGGRVRHAAVLGEAPNGADEAGRRLRTVLADDHRALRDPPRRARLRNAPRFCTLGPTTLVSSVPSGVDLAKSRGSPSMMRATAAPSRLPRSLVFSEGRLVVRGSLRRAAALREEEREFSRSPVPLGGLRRERVRAPSAPRSRAAPGSLPERTRECPSRT